MEEELSIAADYWSRPPITSKRRWWQSPTILQHINQVVCGEPLDAPWAGFAQRIREYGPSKLERGISIGCGEGIKEIYLVRDGIVESFDLFEISLKRADGGRKVAEQHGLSDRVKFHVCDAFEARLDPYDFVYWNNALHHMLDVEQAIRWSYAHLMPGGLFAMDDFVGASRFQWADAELDIAERVRRLLGPRYLRNPMDPSLTLPLRPSRPTVECMISADPTEAADSARILPAIKKIFPNAEITLTGGCIYHLALNDVIANFTEIEDKALLQSLLLADEAFAKSGLTQYAVALATR